jgi:hypothetical protein
MVFASDFGPCIFAASVFCGQFFKEKSIGKRLLIRISVELWN